MLGKHFDQLRGVELPDLLLASGNRLIDEGRNGMWMLAPDGTRLRDLYEHEEEFVRLAFRAGREADVIRDLRVALASQIDITNAERAAKERLESILREHSKSGGEQDAPDKPPHKPGDAEAALDSMTRNAEELGLYDEPQAGDSSAGGEK